ncbi:hypothetical protein V1527DRAFT_456326 [Lipomyces starkeyi]
MNDKKPFQIAYRSRQKYFQESIVIHSKHWLRCSGKCAFLRHMKSAGKLPEKLLYNSRVVMERITGHFYLCVSGPLEDVDGQSDIPRLKCLDPCVRTVRYLNWARATLATSTGCATGWMPSKPVVREGARVQHAMAMKRAAAMIRRRIRNLVADLARW